MSCSVFNREMRRRTYETNSEKHKGGNSVMYVRVGHKFDKIT